MSTSIGPHPATRAVMGPPRWETTRGPNRSFDAVKGASAVEAEPEYRDNTVFVVVPDCGRDSNPAMAVPCQHHFNSRSSHEIFALLVGPGIDRGRVVDRQVDQISLAATLGQVMGFKTSFAEGSVLSEAFGRPPVSIPGPNLAPSDPLRQAPSHAFTLRNGHRNPPHRRSAELRYRNHRGVLSPGDRAAPESIICARHGAGDHPLVAVSALEARDVWRVGGVHAKH